MVSAAEVITGLMIRASTPWVMKVFTARSVLPGRCCRQQRLFSLSSRHCLKSVTVGGHKGIVEFVDANAYFTASRYFCFDFLSVFAGFVLSFFSSVAAGSVVSVLLSSAAGCFSPPQAAIDSAKHPANISARIFFIEISFCCAAVPTTDRSFKRRTFRLLWKSPLKPYPNKRFPGCCTAILILIRTCRNLIRSEKNDSIISANCQ